MDSKIIAAIIGVGGVSIGAFLGGVGYFLKTRSERLQTKKLVLYHLLEIRHLLKSSYFSPMEITEGYIEHCKAFFIKKGVEAEFQTVLQSLLQRHMENLFDAMKPRIDDDFIQSYESALQELCRTDPVLAFKLRGRDSVAETLKVQKSYKDSFMATVTDQSSQDFRQFLENRMGKVESEVVENLIRDIDKDISQVSRKCSVFTWIASSKVTSRKVKPVLDFEEFGVHDLLENMFNDALMNSSSSQHNGR